MQATSYKSSGVFVASMERFEYGEDQKRLHWRGLWHSFSRHGDVVNVYVARKRSRGRRFGFVRMKNKEDVDRVIERLHGFHLYESKLLVKMANNSSKWKGSNITKFQIGRFKKVEGRVEESLECFKAATGTPSILVTTKCIIGHIENEELWQLRKCLAGVMESFAAFAIFMTNS
ncbi:hypothetical protein V6N13_019668 [Hibiscus sabdariffa]